MLDLVLISLTSTAILLAVLLLRSIFKKSTGARWRIFIWMLILLRLCIPVMAESPIGILNINNVLTANKNSTVPLLVNSDRDTSGEILVGESNDNNLPENNTALKQNEKLYLAMRNPLNTIYILGVFISLMIYMLRIVALNVRVMKFDKCINTEVIMLFEEVKSRMGIRKNIEVIIDKHSSSPALFGLINTYIIIPEKALKNSANSLEYVFIHELMHYKQRDLWKLSLIEIAACIHWFNPILHMIKSVIIQDIELSCDEKVLSIINKFDYVKYGAIIADYSIGSFAAIFSKAVASFASRGCKSLKERLLMIKGYNGKRNAIVGMVISFCMLILLVSCTTNNHEMGLYLSENEQVATDKLPGSFNWQDEGVVITPQDQRPYGAGGIFASTSIFESSIAIETGEKVNLSEQLFINNTDYWKSETGVSPEKVLQFFEENGVFKDEVLPYSGIKGAAAPTNDKVYKLVSWGSFELEGFSLEERKSFIKSYLLEYGPVTTPISLYNDYMNYTGGLYECDVSSGVISGHWLTIIGWKDDESINSGGYWVVKESWGTNWGEDGFVKLSYGDPSGIDDYIIYYVDVPLA